MNEKKMFLTDIIDFRILITFIKNFKTFLQLTFSGRTFFIFSFIKKNRPHWIFICNVASIVYTFSNFIKHFNYFKTQTEK